MHIKDVSYKGYTHHASKDEPQYEIKSDKRAQSHYVRAVLCGISDPDCPSPFASPTVVSVFRPLKSKAEVRWT